MTRNLFEEVRQTLKPRGPGHTLKQLKELFGNEVRGVLKALEKRGDATLWGGKFWYRRIAPRRVSSSNIPKPEPQKPVLKQKLEEVGYEQKEGRIVRRKPYAKEDPHAD